MPATSPPSRRAIEYIHAGDCFQVNLSQRLLAPRHAAHPLELYGRLRERNPAPFAGYFDLGDFVVASASPERFLRVDERRRRDAADQGHPAARRARRRRTSPIARACCARAKDRAENVMIVDLLRNDLGRVCEYGSVRVPARVPAGDAIDTCIIWSRRCAANCGRGWGRSICCGRRSPAAR